MARQGTVFRFKSILVKIKGNLISTAVFLPPDIIQKLPEGRVRTKGTINGIPFALAPQYRKEGGRFFSVSASLRKAAKTREGDEVEIVFKLVDPLTVDMPEELAAVLAQDDEAQEVWETITAGMQRSLIHYITSAKSVDVRIKRSLELMQKAKAKSLGFQKAKTKKG